MAAQGARVVANFSESVTSARRLKGIERREAAVRLRIAGRSYPEIAAELGMSQSGAHKTVTVALAGLRERCNENAEQLRTLETERLTAVVCDADAILRRPEAADSNRLRALELKVRVSESLRKLWGLDAPAELNLQGGIALRVVEEIVDVSNANCSSASDSA